MRSSVSACALLLALLLIPGAAWAGPDSAEAKAFVEALEAADAQALSIGPMSVKIAFIPDVFVYSVAKDLAALELGEGDDVATAVKRLVAKHRSKRDKPGFLVRFVHEGYRPPGGSADFFALENKFTKKISVEQIGRGKAKYEVLETKGKIDATQFTLFQASSSDLFRGQNVPPVVKRKYFTLRGDYSLDLMLRKPLHENTKKLVVDVSGLVHFSGNVTATQMDFTRGARAEYLKGSEVSFSVPTIAPVEPPPGLAELLKSP